MAHAKQSVACELADGGHLSATGPGDDGDEDDDAESPPCKRAKM